jgi:hypothetical protein
LPGASSFRVPDSVLSTDFGTAIVVLSLENGRYYTLDETASQLWRLLSAPERPGMRSIPTSSVFSESLIADMLGLGLIIDGDDEAHHKDADRPLSHRPRQPLSVPSLVTATAWLSCISLALRSVGLRSVWRWAHGSHSCEADGCPNEFADVLTHQVARASALSPVRCQCLEQSLFVLRWLRASGVDAALRLGIMQYPFRAHAWVEVHGAVVNDSAERIRVYRPLGDWQCLPLSPARDQANCTSTSRH